MPGSFDFLHIKSRTAGSSNELSFDVLDAARSQLDDKNQKSSRIAKTPSASKGSYHGVAGTSTLSAVPEVERRKKLRRARAIRVRIMTVLIVLIAVGALSFAGYSFYQSRLDFASRYNDLVDKLSEVDESLVVIDAVMGDPLAAGSEAARADAVAKIDSVAHGLDAVSADTEKTIAYAMGDRDTVALTQMDSAIEGRKKMLSAAKETLSIASQYDKELAAARDAWGDVLSADQMAREATASANSASTDETTEAAKQATQAALDKFVSAKEALEGVHLRHEGIDFSEQEKYLDKRIESLEYAIETSDALIAGDRNWAQSSNDAYNEADEEAALLAEDLPLLVDELVKSSFKKDIAPSLAKYNDARDEVAEFDADIRAYLSS